MSPKAEFGLGLASIHEELVRQLLSLPLPFFSSCPIPMPFVKCIMYLSCKRRLRTQKTPSEVSLTTISRGEGGEGGEGERERKAPFYR